MRVCRNGETYHKTAQLEPMAEETRPTYQMIRIGHEQWVKYRGRELDVTEMARASEVGQTACSAAK